MVRESVEGEGEAPKLLSARVVERAWPRMSMRRFAGVEGDEERVVWRGVDCRVRRERGRHPSRERGRVWRRGVWSGW